MDIYQALSSASEVYGYIYKITNSVNGTPYIGQTSKICRKARSRKFMGRKS